MFVLLHLGLWRVVTGRTMRRWPVLCRRGNAVPLDDLAFYVRCSDVACSSPRRDRIASGVPFPAIRVDAMLAGLIECAMVIAKGSCCWAK